MYKLNINPSFYIYYSIVITLFLVGVGFVAYDYFNLNHSLSSQISELKSNTSKLESNAKAVVTTKAPEDTKPCQDWIGTNIPLDEKDVCFYDGDRDVQTNSDILVWSYSEKKWIEPVGTGDPKVATIIRPNDTELGIYYPVIIKCPWGCTLGYTE
jgi:hypothetical protein